MLSIERHEQILQILMEKKSVTVGELSKTMFVSDATIRRDLSQMEKEGLIKRSHGGAVLFESTNDETSILMREQENIKQKKVIAEIALKFIKNHDTLLVDSSSTAGMVIPLLKNFKFISVITNGIKNLYRRRRGEQPLQFHCRDGYPEIFGENERGCLPGFLQRYQPGKRDYRVLL